MPLIAVCWPTIFCDSKSRMPVGSSIFHLAQRSRRYRVQIVQLVPGDNPFHKFPATQPRTFGTARVSVIDVEENFIDTALGNVYRSLRNPFSSFHNDLPFGLRVEHVKSQFNFRERKDGNPFCSAIFGARLP